MAVPLQIRPFESAIIETDAGVRWVEQSQAVMVALDALVMVQSLMRE